MNSLVDDGFIVLGGPLSGEREILHAISAPSEQAVPGATCGRQLESERKCSPSDPSNLDNLARRPDQVALSGASCGPSQSERPVPDGAHGDSTSPTGRGALHYVGRERPGSR